MRLVMARELLSAGADPVVADTRVGGTALHSAALVGSAGRIGSTHALEFSAYQLKPSGQEQPTESLPQLQYCSRWGLRNPAQALRVMHALSVSLRVKAT